MTRGIVATLFACGLALAVSSAHAMARTGTGIVVSEETYTVQGQVASPGTYEFKTGLTVGQAIAQAGGMTGQPGTVRIRLTRTMYGKPSTTTVNSGKSVRPGDTIVVERKP